MRNDLSTRSEIVLQKPAVMKGAECLARLFFALLLSRSVIFNTYTPFGVAMVAVSGTGLPGLFALIGVMLGSFLGGGFLSGLKYTAASVLIYAAAFVFRDLRAYRRAWFMPAAAAILSACTGFVYAADAGWTLAATIGFFMETCLIGGSAYFYQIALNVPKEAAEGDEQQELRRTVSLLVLTGTCLIALSGVTLTGGISVGRLTAMLLVMAAAWKGGLGAGSAVGAGLGLAMDLGAAGLPFYSMAYAFSGLFSGVFSRHGKLFFTLSFILSCDLAVLWTWNSVLNTSILYEVFIDSVLFMLIPSSVLSKLPIGYETAPSYYGGVRIREYARQRIDRLAEAFREVSATRRRAPQRANDGDVATLFDRAADVCCRKCALAGDCWHRNYVSTLNAMNDATRPMMRRGKLKLEDFPSHFSESCKHIDRYIAAVNEELKALLYRRQYTTRLRENQEMLYGQYEELSEILQGVATELSTELTFAPFAERRLRQYLKNLELEAETAVFKDRNGRLHAEIKGGNLRPLLRDRESLDKLSAVLGVRLCEKREETALGQSVTLLEAEPLAAAVGIAAARKRGELVSGDQGTYFKSDDGILFVILSDGMGSGDEAAGESSQTVRLLKRFLLAGLEPASAMKILNAVMLLRNEESVGLVTIDLLCVNLFTGQARLLKYGAAPSYVKNGKSVRRFEGESLAAGLMSGQGALPDVVELRLDPGNFAIIVSDGILNGEDDGWLRTLAAGYEGKAAKELARMIVEQAAEKTGRRDDMTVLTVFLEERS